GPLPVQELSARTCEVSENLTDIRPGQVQRGSGSVCGVAIQVPPTVDRNATVTGGGISRDRGARILNPSLSRSDLSVTLPDVPEHTLLIRVEDLKMVVKELCLLPTPW